ncbi:MAG: hypothetical protein LBD03_03010 [Methanobrevibacter sp.]|jgi:hypothetical protein|nr:hypothetical protein [Candidatus Methanovirga procula]
MDEIEYRKELLDLEHRYYDKMDANQKEYNEKLDNHIKLFLTIMGSFILIIGLLMTVLKIWS